jgi:hypothetical protein
MTAKLENARRHLALAEDRQTRAQTTEEWLADQAAIDRYKSEIEKLERATS